MWGSNLIQLHKKDILTAKQAQISPKNLPDSKGAQVKMTNEQWQNIQIADPEISIIVSLLKTTVKTKRDCQGYRQLKNHAEA